MKSTWWSNAWVAQRLRSRKEREKPIDPEIIGEKEKRREEFYNNGLEEGAEDQE